MTHLLNPLHKKPLFQELISGWFVKFYKAMFTCCTYLWFFWVLFEFWLRKSIIVQWQQISEEPIISFLKIENKLIIYTVLFTWTERMAMMLWILGNINKLFELCIIKFKISAAQKWITSEVPNFVLSRVKVSKHLFISNKEVTVYFRWVPTPHGKQFGSVHE